MARTGIICDWNVTIVVMLVSSSELRWDRET